MGYYIHHRRKNMRCIFFCIFILCISLNILGKESLIEKVYIFDYLTKECLNCDEKEDKTKLMEIINFKDSNEILEWLHNFSTEGKYWNYDYYGSFKGYLITNFIFYNQKANYKLEYKEIPCKVFDCYKAYLTLKDMRGKKIWKKRSPFIDAPIYPLTMDKYIIYIGSRYSPVQKLIIISLNTGKVLEEFSVKDEPFGFSDGTNPYDLSRYLPFYINGYIYLESNNDSIPTEEKGKYIPKIPHKIYLIKVKF